MLITTAGELAKFKYDKEITKENIEKFVHDFINNKLEKYLKSEEDPGDQSGKPDKVAVGKTFDREILNNNKDILVKFYAPWCSHCKAL